MKKFSFLLIVAISIGFTASAQQKKPLTVKIQTPGMLCDECKKRVEDYLKYEEGVTKVVGYPRSKYVQVTYFADRTNIENIKTAIANAGYDADDVRANEDSYKKLPKDHRRPEDGGHQKKN
jgi:copper chaperone CopZ